MNGKFFTIFLLIFISITSFTSLAFSDAKQSDNTSLTRKHKTGAIFLDPHNNKHGFELKQVKPISANVTYKETAITSHFNYNYLPPVGEQEHNDCASWAVGYYLKTYQENKERNITDSTEKAKSENICSPSYLYNMVYIPRDNIPGDKGSYLEDNFKVLYEFGCASMDKMPYDEHDYTKWPSEEAFRDGIAWRTITNIPYHSSLNIPTSASAYNNYYFYWMQLDSDESIDQVKQLILNGKLVIFIINVYKNFYHISNYNNIYAIADLQSGWESRGGHAQTIIGFDDNFETPDGKGAFRVVNSWGKYWGDNGFYWISYKAIQYGSPLSYGYVYWTDDRNHYSSSKVIKFKFTDEYLRSNDFWIECKDQPSKYDFLDFHAWSRSRNLKQDSPSSNIVLDVKEFVDKCGISEDSDVDTTSQSIRLYMHDRGYSDGSIDLFRYQDTVYSYTADDTPIYVDIDQSNYSELYIENPTFSNSWTNANHGNDGWYIGDFNGDGKDDIMRYVPGRSGGQVFLSDGNQFY